MTHEEFYQKLVQIIARETGWSETAIVRQSKFEADLGFDSLDRVCTLMEVENQFGVSLPEGLDETFVTVGDALNWLVENTPS